MKDKIIAYIRHELSAEGNNNLKLIKEELKTIGGQFVTDGYRVGYLVGAVATHEDYYYILLNNDKKIYFISCVGKIYKIDENVDLSKFEDLICEIKSKPFDLKESIKEQMSTLEDVFFTPLYIGNEKMFLPINQMVLSHNGDETKARLEELSSPQTEKSKRLLQELRKKRDFIKQEKAKIMETKTKYINESTIIEEESQVDIEKLEVELRQSKNKYIYLLAEFENYKKRTLKEKDELKKTANEQILKSIISLVDDFERGLKMSQDDGLVLLYNKFSKFLEENDVIEMKTDNAQYDCNLHEAVGIVECGKNGEIIETVQKGYFLHDKILRHAKVIVGN